MISECSRLSGGCVSNQRDWEYARTVTLTCHVLKPTHLVLSVLAHTMANYHYDEAGNMAAYFLITFLAIILIPLTLSLRSGLSMCLMCFWRRLY